MLNNSVDSKRPDAVGTLSVDAIPLSTTRDVLTSMPPEPRLEQSILALVDSCLKPSVDSSPLHTLRRILEGVREIPRGDERLHCLNTIVRTLGQPSNLAAFLDALRLSYGGSDPAEHALAAQSRDGRMHAIYGWSGQTSIVYSSPDRAKGTTRARLPDLDERLHYPHPLWWMSIHVWQPNPNADGFGSAKEPEPELRMEPPHSHPFDFASMVSVGEMHQSTYEVVGSDVARCSAGGRYSGIPLERVDHVWPPHQLRETSYLRTTEHRVRLQPGDSYYLPSHRVHDVDVEFARARTHPTITLFLATEGLSVPESFIAPSMADYHDAHPDLVARATPLGADAWAEKLRAVSAYLRDESVGLDLADIVGHEDSYAFFHL